MSGINQAKCRKIVRAAFAKGKELGLQPLSVVVLDAGGHVLAFERQDGASPGRFAVAHGKAYGAVMMGMPSSKLGERAEAQAYFVTALNGAFDGKVVPVAGGVLARDKKGKVMGAVGVTGDSSDNDALAAVAGIEAGSLIADA